jgi:tetratricopeptide (TPR) repeat protein
MISRPTSTCCVLALCTLALFAGCSKSASDNTAPPDDASAIALNNKGVGLMGRFEYPEAVDAFTQVVQQHSNWTDAQVNLAIATLNRQADGDEETALQILQAAVQADPDNARAWYCMGILKRYLGPPYDARPDFARAVELAPDNAEAEYFLGQCLMDERDYEGALAAFERATKLDPYQRSAQFGISRALRALGREEDSTAALALFDRLEDNPRARTVEFKYSRMGDLAMTLAVGAPDAIPVSARPEGPVWAPARRLNFEGVRWRRPKPEERISVTAADIDGDGDIDVFIANVIDTPGAKNAVLLNERGELSLDLAHPLADTPDVRAALWGDYDNDGLTDVYLCRRGPNVLYRQSTIGVWEDVTSAAGVAGGNLDTVDGAFADADHDGDLDIFCVNENGKNELFSNNLDGAFRTIAQAQNIAGNGLPSRQVLFSDLDRDRDADIIVLHEKPPHEIYINDRLWQYHAPDGFEAVKNADLRSITAIDLDTDGNVELVGRLRGRDLANYRAGDDGTWSEVSRERRDGDGVAAFDADGDGSIEALTPDRFGWQWPETSGASAPARSGTIPEHWGWSPVVLDASEGAAVALYGAIGVEPGVYVIEPGSGRYSFVALEFSGREDQGQSMRSNASGIGVRYEARRGVEWTIGDTFDDVSSPGQGLQPTLIGLAGAEALDFIALDWPDGVFQSEIEVAAGARRISETQRQLSSCPLIFAWDGERYRFISDILGVGGIGYAIAPGEYGEPRPWENFLFPEGSIAPRDGRMIVKVGEPMEEACYLDSVGLVAYDLPPGWKMTLDERMGILGPAPTGAPVFYRDEITPIRAWNDRHEDQTSAIADADLRAADVGAIDERFIGMLAREHVLTVEFARPIGDHTGTPTLLIDGWVEYPYSQTNFAAWQAGATYDAPTLEARDADGAWRVVYEQFGYPAGMPRQMSVAMPNLPAGTTALRLRTNQEIYFDRISVVYAEACSDVVRAESELLSARLSHTGFPRRTTGAQRLPAYDYSDRTPFWDTKAMRGLYTRFGPVDDLLRNDDGALVIFGAGEEAHIEFAAPTTGPISGWTRRWVLESAGWCKDMDLFTRDGDTVAPIPGQNGESPSRDSLHAWYNVRMQSGR